MSIDVTDLLYSKTRVFDRVAHGERRACTIFWW